MRRHEAGFSTLEALIALAITIAIGFATLAVVHGFVRSLHTTYASIDGTAALDDALASMRSQASTSLAVFVPTTDVYGRPNAALGEPGHEVDFYSKRGTDSPVFWAYVYDERHATLARVDYDAQRRLGVRDATTGVIDTNASYLALGNVTSFSAQGLMADALAKSSSPYGSAFSSTAASKIVDLPVSMDNDGLRRPDSFAGNTVVQIRVGSRNVERVVHLAAGAFPSGFTVSAGPAFHAILWRTDTTVKRLFGTRSYVYIWADVDVSYDDWRHYQVWCHGMNIYGAPGGLRKGDPHEDYNASDPAESASRILDLCVHGTGTPGSDRYIPPHPTPPSPDPHASPYPTAAPGSY